MLSKIPLATTFDGKIPELSAILRVSSGFNRN